MKITEQQIFNARLLIVDDQPSNVFLLREILRDAGYTSIESTSNPAEVPVLHQTNHYDLILLDLQMPGVDGFQVMERLHQVEPDGNLSVLVITAQPIHKLRALAAGARDFISKPYTLTEVQSRVRNLLEVRLLYKNLQNKGQPLEQAVPQYNPATKKNKSKP